MQKIAEQPKREREREQKLSSSMYVAQKEGKTILDVINTGAIWISLRKLPFEQQQWPRALLRRCRRVECLFTWYLLMEEGVKIDKILLPPPIPKSTKLIICSKSFIENKIMKSTAREVQEIYTALRCYKRAYVICSASLLCDWKLYLDLQNILE